ncbi:MAG: DUF1211 domain-containing protein [Candidatus Micrarchaeota archaeon]|nr:DUF1211 domain-containing protein [Candidatus Micrarchaeota archaeon]MDE1804729.1 DUF1211 domain-containing protein [Candidatus Micrarchaeota archaeon]MDE1847060.1 DUF1211 domain-containing protein [Candidatus Micrarchaeota archaeon]
MPKKDIHTVASFTKQRAENLTDGIFATVMTILVLSLVVPVITTGNIGQALSSDLQNTLPDILVYVMSFLVLGTLWIGHNNIFRYLERAERNVQWINLIFLLSVGFIPFTTALLGKYPLQHIAVMVYGINLLAVGVIYSIFYMYALREKLVHRDIDRDFVRGAFRRSSVGVFIYFFGIVFSFINPWISIALYVFMPIYYLAIGILSSRL